MSHLPNRNIDFTATLTGYHVGTGGTDTVAPTGLGENDEIVSVAFYPSGGLPAIVKVAAMPEALANLEGSGVTAGLIELAGDRFIVSGDANTGPTVYDPGVTYYFVVQAQLR